MVENRGSRGEASGDWTSPGKECRILTSDLQLASPRLRVKGWCVTLLLLLTTPSSQISMVVCMSAM